MSIILLTAIFTKTRGSFSSRGFLCVYSHWNSKIALDARSGKICEGDVEHTVTEEIAATTKQMK